MSWNEDLYRAVQSAQWDGTRITDFMREAESLWATVRDEVKRQDQYELERLRRER